MIKQVREVLSKSKLGMIRAQIKSMERIVRRQSPQSLGTDFSQASQSSCLVSGTE